MENEAKDKGVALMSTYSRGTEISDSKESACIAGNPGSIPGSGRSTREGSGKPLQYSCLENSMDRRACWATVHGAAESDMSERLPLKE